VAQTFLSARSNKRADRNIDLNRLFSLVLFLAAERQRDISRGLRPQQRTQSPECRLEVDSAPAAKAVAVSPNRGEM